MLDPAVLVVLAFAAFRLTRLLTSDTLTQPWRARLYDFAWDDEHPITSRDGESLEPAPRAPWRTWLYELLTCGWCVGVWISAATYLAWREGPGWIHAALVVASIAGLQGLLASKVD